MKKLYSLLLLATALTANAQQVNGDFDSEWEKCYPWVAGSYITDARGLQPQGWRSSNVNGMKGTGATIDQVVEVVPGYKGSKKAALIQNSFIDALIATSWSPGYLTLGTPWNTAVGSAKKNQDGGTWGGMAFKYKPDAVTFHYKWDKTVEGKASFIGYLWKGTYKQDNVPTDVALRANKVTKVTMEDRDRNILGIETSEGTKPIAQEGTLIASYEDYIDKSATDWTKKTIKFKYVSNETPAKINLIFASTDYFSTVVSKGKNPLTIDEVTLVYYKHLSKLTINGTTPSSFVNNEETEDNTNLVTIDASDVEYTEGCVKAEAAGAGATFTTSYNPLTAVYTITVTSGDGKQKVYEIQFKKVYNQVAYTNSLLVHYYDYFPISQNTIYLLSHKEKEQYGFILEKFEFVGSDMGMIYVKDLKKTANADGSVTYSNSEPEMVYIEGLQEEVLVTVNATVSKDNQMAATIKIPLEEGNDEETVIVTYGPQLTINPSTSLEVSNATGLTNVVMNRTFAAGWNTYCMPFDYNLSSLSAEAKAQEFVSSNGSSLTFEAVNDGVLKANVPYLVYFPTETTVGTTEAPLYFVTNVASYQPTSVEHNGFTFVGNYEASKSMEGLYGVASEGDVQKIMLGTAGSTLPATCAYFTAPTGLNANGLRICFDGGEVTGINQVNGAQAQSAGAVYNLQGIKVSNRGTNNLPAGLYIMQGKKVIVK
uniref:calycin-like domain-containing protein n=1 Tax=Alloprevotella sp. TaxID=1872471 RepID=UPI0040280798